MRSKPPKKSAPGDCIHIKANYDNLPCDIIDQKGTGGTSVIGTSNRSERFLTSLKKKYPKQLENTDEAHKCRDFIIMIIRSRRLN